MPEEPEDNESYWTAATALEYVIKTMQACYATSGQPCCSQLDTFRTKMEEAIGYIHNTEEFEDTEILVPEPAPDCEI